MKGDMMNRDQWAWSEPSCSDYVGILLAAGRGRRFDPDGIRNKLLQMLPGGTVVVVQAAWNLHAALASSLLVVVPAEAPAFAAHLLSCGFPVTECAAADSGMAASLVHGVRQAHAARGWIIGLGDMPFVHPATMARMVAALAQGADIVVPVYQGVRGNPVGFSRWHRERLLQLEGDRGARQLLQEYPVTEVEVEDPGIHRDIDTVADLQQNWPAAASGHP